VTGARGGWSAARKISPAERRLLAMASIDEGSFDSKLATVGLVADVSAAGRALAAQPTVALVSICLWWFPILVAAGTSGSPHRNPWLGAADVALLLVFCGWAGAERIFFLRHFAGRAVTLRHLLYLVKAFVGRFLALGLLAAVAMVVWSVLLSVLSGGGVKAQAPRSRIGTMAFTLALDVSLTFVPAALAFTTRSVRRALRIGFAMIRQTWPRCALYVLCPPLALNLNSVIYHPADLPMLRLLGAAALAVVALLAKGATVAFYLRQLPVNNDDGAAYIAGTDEPRAD